MKPRFTILLPLLLAVGCVSLEERRIADRAFVEGEILERTGLRLDGRHAFEDGGEDDFVAPLEVDAAVRLALAHDPRVDELLAELEQASAQRVRAELVRNPFVRVEMLFGSGGADLGAGLVQPIADLLTLSSRRSIAEKRNEAERMRIAREIVRLVHDVRRAFSTVAFDARAAALSAELREAEEAAARLASELHAAGNTTSAALHAQLAEADVARLAAEHAESRARTSRAALARAIGRPALADRITVAAPPAVATLEPHDTSTALTAAIAASLRMHELRAESRAHAIRAGLAPLQASLEGAVVEGMVTSSDNELAANVPLPIFDGGETAAAAEVFALNASRAAEQRASLDVVAALEHIEARRSSAFARANFMRTRSVTNAHALVVASLQQYNAMQVDVFTVLAARRVELAARRDELAAAREFDWYEIAFSELLAGSTPRLAATPNLDLESN